MAEFPIVKGDGATFGYSSSKIGFYGAAPVVQAPVVALTSAFGTADNALADVGGAFNQTTLNNNFKDLQAKLEEVRAALDNLGLIS